MKRGFQKCDLEESVDLALDALLASRVEHLLETVVPSGKKIYQLKWKLTNETTRGQRKWRISLRCRSSWLNILFQFLKCGGPVRKKPMLLNRHQTTMSSLFYGTITLESSEPSLSARLCPPPRTCWRTFYERRWTIFFSWRSSWPTHLLCFFSIILPIIATLSWAQVAIADSSSSARTWFVVAENVWILELKTAISRTALNHLRLEADQVRGGGFVVLLPVLIDPTKLVQNTPVTCSSVQKMLEH